MNPLNRLKSRTLGIDLGTVNTVVVSNGILIAEEPTCVVYDEFNKQKYFGNEAAKIVYDVEGLNSVWPMEDGKIKEFDTVGYFLEHFLAKVTTKILKWDLKTLKRIVVAIPCQLEPMYKTQVVSVCSQFTQEVVLVEQPVAAAHGEHIDLEANPCVLVYDIGGGTTDGSTVTLFGTTKDASRTCTVGGNKEDQAIVEYILKKCHVNVSLRRARDIKHAIGCALPPPAGEAPFYKFKAPHCITGQEVVVRLLGSEMPEILSGPQNQMIEFALEWFAHLGKTNPETLVRVQDGLNHDGVKMEEQTSSIVLTGGGGLLKRRAELMTQKLGVHFRLAQDPLRAAGRGADILSSNETLLQRYRIRETNWRELVAMDPRRDETYVAPRQSRPVAKKAGSTPDIQMVPRAESA